MEIKEHKLRFEVGDRFEYECVPNDFTQIKDDRRKVKKILTTFEVIGVYPHFILCRRVDIPSIKISITNNELYQVGIYNEGDFKAEFKR